MAKEIIINATKGQTRIAIVENGELVELRIEDAENARTIGNIFLGRIRRIMPSIQACFVDIGQKQDAFLHFTDLSSNLGDLLHFVTLPTPNVEQVELKPEQHRLGRRRHPRHQRSTAKPRPAREQETDEEAAPEGEKQAAKADQRARRRSAQKRATRRKDDAPAPNKGREEKGATRAKGRPSEAEKHEEQGRAEPPPRESLLKRDQPILVKIVKEPISNKGSRVSTDISLAGRFLVLVPLSDYIAVSKKIYSYKERRRLRALAKSLVPPGYGVIVRTVASGKNAKELDTDLRLLVDKWRKIEKTLASQAKPPVLVHEDVNMVSSVIRDLFSDDYDRILIDDMRMHRNIKNYIQAVAPQMASAVQLHKGDTSVFQTEGIAKAVTQAFESRVDLPSGGYLFIEHTEAMHVIDVNSGRSGRGMKQEESSLKVNLESARVIAQQIRLRDLGGIIVVDFIDLREERNRRKVHDELRKAFRKDRAVTKVLPMSDFGLIQITRQRLRPSITTLFDAPKEAAKAPEPAEKAPDAVQPVRRQPQPPRRQPGELVEAIETGILKYKETGTGRSVGLRVHPFTAAYLTRKMPTLPTRWLMRHRIRVRLEADPKLSPMQFSFIDPTSGKDITQHLLNGAVAAPQQQKGNQVS